MNFDLVLDILWYGALAYVGVLFFGGFVLYERKEQPAIETALATEAVEAETLTTIEDIEISFDSLEKKAAELQENLTKKLRDYNPDAKTNMEALELTQDDLNVLNEVEEVLEKKPVSHNYANWSLKRLRAYCNETGIGDSIKELTGESFNRLSKNALVTALAMVAA